jgi:membrane-associated protease RseP (regulator of RpoE activity)
MKITKSIHREMKKTVLMTAFCAVLLMAMMLFVTFNDVMKLFG